MRSNKEIIELMDKLREQNNYSFAELARQVNMAKSAISRYFNGTRQFPLNRVDTFAKALGVSPEYILGVKSESKENTITEQITSIVEKLPTDQQQKLLESLKEQVKHFNKTKSNVVKVNNDYRPKKVVALGYASAGTGEFLIDNMKIEKNYYGSVPKTYDYALIVNGDSMEPMFQDGQIIFIARADSETEFLDGQIVIAELNGAAYIKKLRILEKEAQLISMNNKYDPIKVTENDEFVIVGKVIL
ncbi:helix-turn-helix domain-containing protein [Pediococcus pentosaceus]|uniref:XRE family transcriptional regulator n=1 Tax=Pediococcus pentosaceus TaxID=1255 RepID=UPI001C1EDFC6|nr:S24 family peptidase [Pediococcus pentosaceus]MBU7002119.1 helix-turn-helix domain-containing protein [Pediococcus pentosaceus]MCG9227389.1 helix-turn-helix domain-containing protein [Pediococcus pentosaceus]MDA8037474.1 helix-turn-helix domain-containing protein [Pediococcus pentosaceus]